MTQLRSHPTRTCVGCRRRFDDGSLVRLVVRNGSLATSVVSHGRGAWICRASSCANTAVAKGNLRRALRTDVSVSLNELENLTHSCVARKG